jgi:conjugal transfer mating pair stabilization protein TraN
LEIISHFAFLAVQFLGTIIESLSKLAAFSAMKPDKDKQFNLFAGRSGSCSKKALEYTNCCSVYPKGWGRQLGAKCTPGEKELSEKRQNNLCVYVGKKNHKKAGVTVFVKQHYCCFSNILDKIIQVEGRKQLGRGFGSASSPDCSGFSLEDIKGIDFNEVDFSEFIEQLQRKFKDNNKSMDAGKISSTVQDSVDDLKKYDGNNSNPENNRSGHNEKINQKLLEGAEQEL